MDDKKITAWKNAKQDFLDTRRALHDAIGGRTQGVYGEMVADWTCFNPVGKPRMTHLSFGPRQFDPSRLLRRRRFQLWRRRVPWLHGRQQAWRT
jgi:hypothetical protein